MSRARGPSGRRHFLACAGALVAGQLAGRRAAAAIDNQYAWIAALARELRLVRRDEPTPKVDELIRRLGVPPVSELTADALVLRSNDVKAQKYVSTGRAAENWLTPSTGTGVVVFRTLVNRPGRHLVRLRVKGGPHLVSFGTRETRAIEAVEEDAVREIPGLALKPGWTEIAVSLAPGGALERVVVHPEAGSPIAPIGGWKPAAPLTLGAKATTIVRLGGWEEELPPAEAGPRPLMIVGGADHQGRSVRKIRIEAEGVYTLAARISGMPPAQILLDEAQLFPRPGIAGIRPPAGTGTLVSLGTLALEARDYDVTFHGAGGAVHELLSLPRVANERRYLDIARAHGFENGRMAKLPPEAVVESWGIQQNVSSVRSWMIGPLTAPTAAAAAPVPLPRPPGYPDPISPVVPLERWP